MLWDGMSGCNCINIVMANITARKGPTLIKSLRPHADIVMAYYRSTGSVYDAYVYLLSCGLTEGQQQGSAHANSSGQDIAPERTVIP